MPKFAKVESGIVPTTWTQSGIVQLATGGRLP